MSERSEMRTLVRNFLIELVVYGALVVGYFVVVLRWLGEPLVQLFDTNLVVYAVLALVLIIFQGVALEAVTSFLIKLLRLESFE